MGGFLCFKRDKMTLTPKQEKFCREVVKGKDYSAAYQAVYNTKRMKDKTVWEEACRLAKNPKVAARIEELKGKIEEKLVYSALESFKNLEKIQELALARKKLVLAKGKLNDPDLTNALKAEELKGKLAGLYVEKKELSGGIDVTPFKIEVIE